MTSVVSRGSWAWSVPTAGKRTRTAARRMATPFWSGLDQAASDPIEDKCIQEFALLGRSQAGVTDRSGGAFREMPGLSWPVPRQDAGRHFEVLGQLHPDQMRSQEEQQRGVELAPLNRCLALQHRAEIDAEDVHHLNRGLVGPDRAERFQVSLARLSRDDEELAHACPLLPGFDKFV